MVGALLVLGSWLAVSLLASLLLGAVVRRADGPATGRLTRAAALATSAASPQARTDAAGPTAPRAPAPSTTAAPTRTGGTPELVR